MSLPETTQNQTQVSLRSKPGAETQEIDFLELFFRLLENARFIIPVAILGAVLAAVYTSKFVTPLYKATSKIYVVNTSNAVIDVSALNLGSQLSSDYVEVFSNWHVHERVIEKLNLPYSYGKLNSMISVSTSESKRILSITATSASPEEAKLLADTYADIGSEFIAETMSTQKPNLFQEALRPSAPSSPNKTRNILMGFLLGGLAASGVVTLLFVLDDRIHNEEDITRYINLPVLGSMPMQQEKGKKKRKKTGREKKKA